MIYNPVMVRNIFLVGVAHHAIQYTPVSSGPQWEKVIKNFGKYIQDQCSSLGIDLIAEEWSEYSVKQNAASDSTARQAAEEIGVDHLFCDPDPDERLRLGIKNGRDGDPDREKEWLKRLIRSGKTQILFICGDGHLESFKTLLVGSGCNAKFIDRHWGQGYELID